MRFLRRLTARPNSQVDFCDSCARVCTAACRSEALRDRTRTATLAASLYR